MSIRVLVSGGTGHIVTILSHYLHEQKINYGVIDNLSNSSLIFLEKI
jgi:hypothetical protein